jgi:large subunit ribosomal protein L10e
MYRNLAKKAYTRREYMGGVPGSKIVQFDMGNLNQEFPLELGLVASEGCQIRHTALEAARISINRRLLADLGRMNFYLKIRVYPHHILRENKQATGAGADRVSEGMRLAFGKAVGSAARVKPGQKIISLFTFHQLEEKAKDALRHGAYKLPTPSRIVAEEHEVHGPITGPVPFVREKEPEPEETKEAAEAAAEGAEAEAGKEGKEEVRGERRGERKETGREEKKGEEKGEEKKEERKGREHRKEHRKGD